MMKNDIRIMKEVHLLGLVQLLYRNLLVGFNPTKKNHRYQNTYLENKLLRVINKINIVQKIIPYYQYYSYYIIKI